MPVESTPSARLQDVTWQPWLIPRVVAPNFDERWLAWQSRGAAHNRAVRRRAAIAARITAVIAAAFYVLFLFAR